MKSILASICVALLMTSAVASADDSPNAVIDSAIAQLAEQLDGREDELSENRQALYEIIDAILLPRFDRRFAAQLVLARHWKAASEDQQARFIEAFYQAMLRKYADGILEFDPDLITVLPFRGDQSKKRAKVRSTVDLEDGSKVAVDYELVQRSSGWMVFNVIIEGVSYVRNFRAELDSEIKASSLDAVIARLESEVGPAGNE